MNVQHKHGGLLLWALILALLLAGCSGAAAEEAAETATQAESTETAGSEAEAAQVVLTMADLIQEDGTIQFPGVPQGTNREAFADILGMDYSAWGTAMDNLVASGDVEEAPYALEGHPIAVVFPLKDDAVRSAMIYLLDDGSTEEQWYETTQTICGALEAAAGSHEGQRSYTFGDTTVTLEWGPVDSEEVEQLGDGQTGWAGEIGALGTRITQIVIAY